MKYFQASLSLLPLLHLSSVEASEAADTYARNAVDGAKSLNNKYYAADTGLWDKAWWQSANSLTTLAHLGATDAAYKPDALNRISNTYAKAPFKANNGWTADGWLNKYYDDEGWWALAWIASYDLTGDGKYLDTAKKIFEDMTGGWTTPCKGGIWWSKDKQYISTISNELFLSVAAHLANRVPSDKQNYIHWAQQEWDWFSQKGGAINDQNTINDGLDTATCKNNGKSVFTYNQGVVLGGLSELAKATGDQKYTNSANTIAQAAINALSKDGILTESGGDDEDTTLAMFKGVFVRNLAQLCKTAPNASYTNFLKKNADSVWGKAKDKDGCFGPHWQAGDGNPTQAACSSGLDAIVAAALVA